MTDEPPLCSVCGEPLEKGKDYALSTVYEVTFCGDITIRMDEDDPRKAFEIACEAMHTRGMDDLQEVRREKVDTIIVGPEGEKVDPAKLRHSGCFTPEELRAQRIERAVRENMHLPHWMEA